MPGIDLSLKIKTEGICKSHNMNKNIIGINP